MFACKLHSSAGKMPLSHKITTLPFLSLRDASYKTSTLGETVSSINLNQIHFKKWERVKKKKKEALKLTFFLREKYLFTQRRLSLCEKKQS